MARYIVRRVLQLAVTLFGVALLSFLLLKAAGGDPAQVLAGDDANRDVIENLRREFGFDKPLPVQFATFLGKAVQGDFGVSYFTREPVAELIARTYPRTLLLAALAIVFSFVGGVALGLAAALRPYSWVDGLMMLVSVLGLSIPGFWLALMLIAVFSLELGWLPVIGLGSPRHYVLPVIVAGSYSLALTARMTRAGMLEVLHDDYIRTARAKGLRERAVVLRHALRNMLIPVITISALSLGFMLGGTVVVEIVFSIDGIGNMIVEAIQRRDAPVVQAGLMVVAANFVAVLFLLDILLVALNPRIRL
jgi:ABC-type dipeptide/oligopeptide/nickel transport system permease component